MVQARFNGKILDLSELSIDFEFNNPLFQDGSYNAEYSFDFTTPWTARNMAASGYKSRFDNSFATNGEFELIIDGFILAQGTATVSNSDGKMRLQVVNAGVTFQRLFENQDLKSIPMDSVQIYDESDELYDKMDKWVQHKTQEMMVRSPREGMVKYPMMAAAGSYHRDNDALYDLWGAINAFAEGSYLSNLFMLDDDQEDENSPLWLTTTAPCPRIKYQMERVFAYYGVSLVEGKLWTDPEFETLFSFAGVVLDHLYRYNPEGGAGTGANVNIFGSGFSIQDLVPDVKVAALFQMMWEVYGALFYYRKNKVRISTVSEVLSRPMKNISRFQVEGRSEDLAQLLPLKIVYSLQPDFPYQKNNVVPFSYLGMNSEMDDIQYVIIQDGQFIYTDYWRALNETLTEANEVQLGYWPMATDWNPFHGFPADRGQWLSADTQHYLGKGENLPILMYPLEISADASARSQQYVIGYYRGLFDTFQRRFTDEGYEDSVHAEPWSCNYASTEWAEPASGNTVPFNYSFGTSLYLRTARGRMAEWRRKFHALFNNASPVSCNYRLAAHQVVQLAEFQDGAFLIENRNGSRAGFIKRISFTVTERGIGITTIDYMVPNKPVLSMTDFNSDFSEDYY